MGANAVAFIKALRLMKVDVLGFSIGGFVAQQFHLDEEGARDTIFRRLAASGCHTAPLTMRLLVESEINPAGGIVGAGVDELRWPLPVRPGDEPHVGSEVLEAKPSKSDLNRGRIRQHASDSHI